MLIITNRNLSVAKTLASRQLDDLRLYISSGNDIFLMIMAADRCVRNDCKSVPFDASAFYKKLKLIFTRLHIWLPERVEERFASFAIFLETRILQTETSCSFIPSIFISDILLSYCDKIQMSESGK